MSEDKINKYMYKLFNEEKKLNWRKYFVLINDKSIEFSEYIKTHELIGENDILKKIKIENGRIYSRNNNKNDYSNSLKKFSKDIKEKKTQNIEIDTEKINRMTKILSNFCEKFLLNTLKYEKNGYKLNDYLEKEIGDVYKLNRLDSRKMESEIANTFYDIRKEISNIFIDKSYQTAVDNSYYILTKKYEFSLNYLLNRVRHMNEELNDEYISDDKYMYILIKEEVKKLKIFLSIEDIIIMYNISFNLLKEMINVFEINNNFSECIKKDIEGKFYLNDNTEIYTNLKNQIDKKNNSIYSNDYSSLKFIKEIYSDFTYNLLGMWTPLHSENIKGINSREVRSYVWNLFSLFLKENKKIDNFLNKTKFLTKNIWEANKINYILNNINSTNEFLKKEIISDYLMEFTQLKTHDDLCKEKSKYLTSIVGDNDSKIFFSITFKLIRILSEFKDKYEDENMQFVNEINSISKGIDFNFDYAKSIEKVKHLIISYENYINKLIFVFEPIFKKEHKIFLTPETRYISHVIYISLLNTIVSYPLDDELINEWSKYFIADEDIIWKNLKKMDRYNYAFISYVGFNIIKFLGYPESSSDVYNHSIDFNFDIYSLFDEEVIKLYLISNKKNQYIIKIIKKLEDKIKEIVELQKNNKVEDILSYLYYFIEYLYRENYISDRIFLLNEKINDKHHIIGEIRWYLKSYIFQRLRYEKERIDSYYESTRIIQSIYLIKNYESIINATNLLKKTEWNKLAKLIKKNEINYLKKALDNQLLIGEFKTYDNKKFKKTYKNINDVNLNKKMRSMIIEKSKKNITKEKRKLWIESIVEKLNDYNDSINKMNELKDMFFKTYTINENDIQNKIYKKLKNKYKTYLIKKH